MLPALAVLFTSGYTENAIVHGGRLDKGVELLGKPYTRAALARKVRHVLSNQAQQAMPAPPPMAAGGQQRGAPLHILLVEDDDVIRDITTELLDSLGHVVQATDSAERALDLLSATTTVLMTDIKLPGMSGEALAVLARQRFPHLAIVFASGGQAGHTPGGAVLLRKPYDHVALAAALRQAATVEDAVGEKLQHAGM